MLNDSFIIFKVKIKTIILSLLLLTTSCKPVRCVGNFDIVFLEVNLLISEIRNKYMELISISPKLKII